MAGELTPGFPPKSQEYLQMKEVHVASAPVICKSRATESSGEGIDPKRISEAIKGQLHAHREGPQHPSSRPCGVRHPARLAYASSDRKPEATLLPQARCKHSLPSNHSRGQPLALTPLKSATRKEVRLCRREFTQQA